MPISLKKGQGVSLLKDDGSEFTKVVVGLGWDMARRKPEKEAKSGGFFASLFSRFAPQPALPNIDCDASAFLFQHGRLAGDGDIVSYLNLEHRSHCVKHMGDNLTGAGDGDDEQIFVDLEHLPKQYDRVVFVVNIFQAKQRGQHFGMIENAFIRICDDKGYEFCRYNLSENYDNMTAMIFGGMYRHDGKWKFSAIGQATADNDIRSLARKFR